MLAGDPTGLQYGLDGHGVLAGAASKNTPRGGADVGAIKIQPNAVAQVRDHVFGQASIGAPSTALGTFEARGDAIGKLLQIQTAGVMRMGFKH